MSKAEKTLEEARHWFREHGVTMTKWSRDHGFPRDLVYAVLAGRVHGWRGESHRIAVALGIKTLRTNEMASASRPADLRASAAARASRPTRHPVKARGRQSAVESIGRDVVSSNGALNRPAHPSVAEGQGGES